VGGGIDERTERLILKCLYMIYVSIIYKYISVKVGRVATDWTVQGSNPGGGEIFRTCPDRTWGPSLLYNGYRVFPGGRKWPGPDADPSPLVMSRSRNRVQLYLYSP
jgi:hypothetical protein